MSDPTRNPPSIEDLPLTPTKVPMEELDEFCSGLLIRYRDLARAQGRDAMLELATFGLLTSFEAMVLATLGDPALIEATFQILAWHYQAVVTKFNEEYPGLLRVPDPSEGSPQGPSDTTPNPEES